MSTVKIDVIIPAYRPGEEFEKLLERLSAQKYPINRIDQMLLISIPRIKYILLEKQAG